MPDKVSAFMHVEVVHPDPDAAADFMCEIFGAERCEQYLSEWVEGRLPGIRVVHVVMGKIVYQFVRPNDFLPTWKKQLETRGPSVHNVTFQVDGLDTVREQLFAKGCKEVFSLDVDVPGVTVPITGYCIEAVDQVGLRFEMVPSEMGYQPPA